MSQHSDNHVDTTKQAYDQIHEEYAASNRLLNDDVKHNIDRFVTLLAGKVVLDVGCAGGRESGYLADQGLQVSGCDLSEGFVKAARKAYPNCTFFVSDMRRLDQHSAKYDGIWCNAAFLHIPKEDASGTLKTFHRLLNAGGILYLSVMRGEFNGLRENKTMKWPERHFSDYQPEELNHLVTAAGFKPLANSSNETDWGPVFLHGFYRKN